ncbi:MAG: hypothetical protein V3S12_02695 [Acidiferrobacterales bacterium]
MCAPKAPTPPDPATTAAAQTGTNVSTAIANTQLGQVDQFGPGGSLTYDQRGTFDFNDPNSGETYQIPQYSATTALSEGQQAIYDQNQGAQLGLAQTANQQASFLQDYLGTPADFDTSAIEGRLDELGRSRLDPRFERERAAMENRLAQQGNQVGSEAWQAEMANFGQTQNDAYNQLYLGGRSQAFGELAATRNQPINEITALLSGSQVSQPNFPQSAPAQMPTVDYEALVNNNFAQQQQGYQQQLASRNALGGMFGTLGSAAIGAWPIGVA